ncbi:hypothetical protein DR79_1891 [Francisella tularensis]|nr:hypothetical protein DR79_1891 [Francisella tularensis]
MMVFLDLERVIYGLLQLYTFLVTHFCKPLVMQRCLI